MNRLKALSFALILATLASPLLAYYEEKGARLHVLPVTKEITAETQWAALEKGNGLKGPDAKL